MDYIYKTEPFAHQHEIFTSTRDKKAHSLFMEMGTGKTKILLDTACYNHANGNINCLLVFAPNGVHRNWIVDEVTKHVPDWLEHVAVYWKSTPKAAERKQLEKVWTEPAHKMRIIAINSEAIVTSKKCKDFIKRIINTFNVMAVLDESDDFSNPGASRTKFMLSMAKHFKIKRIATGTAIKNQGPLSLYSQYKFLDESILGWSTYSAFRAHYAVIRDTYDPLIQHLMREKNLRKPPIIVAVDENGDKMYKNIPELKKRIAPYTEIRFKKDCVDLPEKIYMPNIYVDMYPVQQKLYTQMLENSVADMRMEYDGKASDIPDNDEDAFLFFLGLDGTGIVRAKNGMAKETRLQQILGGFPKDLDGNYQRLDKIAKLDAIIKYREKFKGKLIIWARFRPEIEAINECLKDLGQSYVEYHGGISPDDREKAKQEFQNGDALNFVGNPKAGGRGLTLTSAHGMVYYSEDYSFATKQQSEDRAHRIGLQHNVSIQRFIHAGTIEEKIAKTHQSNENFARNFLEE